MASAACCVPPLRAYPLAACHTPGGGPLFRRNRRRIMNHFTHGKGSNSCTPAAVRISCPGKTDLSVSLNAARSIVSIPSTFVARPMNDRRLLVQCAADGKMHTRVGESYRAALTRLTLSQFTGRHWMRWKTLPRRER